jgi:hypothetical protein
MIYIPTIFIIMLKDLAFHNIFNCGLYNLSEDSEMIKKYKSRF